MGKKEQNDFKYQIDEVVGVLKESDKHDWVKAVLRVQWGDNPSTLDIRNINMTDKRIGKGISLSNEEADRLVKVLLENDFGTLSDLEDAVRHKKSFFTISKTIDDMLEESEDGPYVIEITP